MGVDEHTVEVAGASIFYRREWPPAGRPIPVYLHSVPSSADDWSPLLEATSGVALDLPGFGRSAKGGQLNYSLTAYVDFAEQFLDALELADVVLVGHGWGAPIALLLALRRPEQVQRLALVDAVPLLEGFEWPGLVRWWRRPIVGELLMGSVTRRMMARTLRAGSASPDTWPEARIDTVWDQFDQGTQRAILRLHRSVDVADLARAGAELHRLKQPALVVWGEADPWLAPSFADAYAARLRNATVHRVAGAGHWPWLEQPAVIERLAGFVAQS